MTVVRLYITECVLLFCLCAGRKRQRAAAAEEEQRGNTDSLPQTQLQLLFTRKPRRCYQGQCMSAVVVLYCACLC